MVKLSRFTQPATCQFDFETLPATDHHPQVVGIEQRLEKERKAADERLLDANSPVEADLASRAVFQNFTVKLAFEVAPH